MHGVFLIKKYSVKQIEVPKLHVDRENTLSHTTQ